MNNVMTVTPLRAKGLVGRTGSDRGTVNLVFLQAIQSQPVGLDDHQSGADDLGDHQSGTDGLGDHQSGTDGLDDHQSSAEGLGDHQTGADDLEVQQFATWSTITGKLCHQVMALINWKRGFCQDVMEGTILALESWLHHRGISIYTDCL
jgi:hypothetical protein